MVEETGRMIRVEIHLDTLDTTNACGAPNTASTDQRLLDWFAESLGGD